MKYHAMLIREKLIEDDLEAGRLWRCWADKHEDDDDEPASKQQKR